MREIQESMSRSKLLDDPKTPIEKPQTSRKVFHDFSDKFSDFMSISPWEDPEDPDFYTNQ